MDIKCELLRGYIADLISNRLVDFSIDADKIADSMALNALSEIKTVLLKNNYSDFETVEEIICIFEKYNLDFGGCHDF